LKKYRYIYSFLFLLVALCIQQMYAQQQQRQQNPQKVTSPADTTRKVVYESSQLKPGSKEYIDSMKQARQRYVDSMKAARTRELDSMRAAQKHITDSTAAANKQYRDSLNTVLEAQRAARMRISDSLKVIQQRRSDSLLKAKAYRESKAYKDSLARMKQARLDSLATLREKRNEQMAADRKRMQDSLAAARKQYNDSLQAVIAAQTARNKVIKDSIAAVRAVRTDSLAKAKTEREALSKKRAKDREKKTTAKERAKEQKKRDAYSNEQMRKKKWGFVRQVYHNTTTRYNYYYNASLNMDKMEQNMLKLANNNYDSLLPLYPFDPDKDSTRFASDMDSLIRRAGVGIQIHDPRSKWQDNMYLLVGKAYYYKGDYTNAANAFKYIVAAAEAEKRQKEKEKSQKKGNTKAKPAEGNDLTEEEKKNIFTHLSSKNDAMLWLARTLAQDSQVNMAQTVLNMVRSSKQFNEDLQGRFSAAQAFVDLKKFEYAESTDDLAKIYDDEKMPKWLRERAAYLRGQILQRENNLLASDSAFAKVVDLKPAMEMDFNARIHLVNNSINAGRGDAQQLMQSLSAMSREAKYKSFYDKIYFTMAKVAERNKDVPGAIANYRKSIQQSTTNPTQKGLSFAAMGALYYDQNKYNEAKISYDSALLFLTEANKPEHPVALQRSQALDKVAAPGNEVRYLDSLLTLSGLSEKEQRAIARRYIKDLEKRINDSIYLAKNPSAAGNNPVLAGPVSLGGGSTFYFANPSMVQQGINTFKQKWGERTLKDSWNRSNNLKSGSGSTAGAEEEEEEIDPLKSLPTEEDLLARIPRTEKDIREMKGRLQQSLFELGTAYYKNMEDIPMAIKTYDDLDKRFPDHPNRAEELYNRYRMALAKSSVADADAFAQTLKSKYADSKWAGLITTNAAQVQEQSSQEDIAAHYERTYNALMSQDYQQAMSNADSAQSLYPNAYAPFANRYTLVRIASIAGKGDYKTADSLLTGFIAQHPNDETAGWAKSLQQYVKKAMQQQPAASASTGANGPQVMAGANVPAAYSYTPANLHYVLIAATGDQNRLAGVRAGLKDYHQSQKGMKELTTSLTPLDGQKNIVVVKEFKNAAAAKAYISNLKKQANLFRDFSANEYEVIMVSSDNIIKLFTDKDWAKYLEFYKNKYPQ